MAFQRRSQLQPECGNYKDVEKRLQRHHMGHARESSQIKLYQSD